MFGWVWLVDKILYEGVTILLLLIQNDKVLEVEREREREKGKRQRLN